MSDETPADARAHRLAEALRANLRRRKAQGRARRAPQADNGADAAMTDPAAGAASSRPDTRPEPRPDTRPDTRPETPWTA